MNTLVYGLGVVLIIHIVAGATLAIATIDRLRHRARIQPTLIAGVSYYAIALMTAVIVNGPSEFLNDARTTVEHLLGKR